MIAAPHIEPATPADIEALARLRVEMGWLRSDPLLHGVLAWEGGRVFVVRARSLGVTADGIADLPVASAGAIVAGPIGVIGNVTVRPEFQRRGLGGLLTAHAIAWQRTQGARAVWLDATPAGRPLYRRLGFEDVAVSWDAHAPLRDLRLERLAALASSISAAKAPADALASVAALDLAAFGGDRTGLLRALLAQQDRYALYIAHDAHDATRRPLGFALTRRLEQPWQGARLGPLIASDDRVAAALTLAAAQAERLRLPAEFAQGAAYITVGCGDAPDIRAYFDSIGLPTEDDDLVMRLSLADDEDDPHSEHTEGQPRVYSWTAPMVF